MSKKARPERADLTDGAGLESRAWTPSDYDEEKQLTTSSDATESANDREVLAGNTDISGTHLEPTRDDITSETTGEAVNPYDRWRNYVPASMARPDAETENDSESSREPAAESTVKPLVESTGEPAPQLGTRAEEDAVADYRAESKVERAGGFTPDAFDPLDALSTPVTFRDNNSAGMPAAQDFATDHMHVDATEVTETTFTTPNRVTASESFAASDSHITAESFTASGTSTPTSLHSVAYESRLVSDDPARMKSVGSPFDNLDRLDVDFRTIDPAEYAPSRKLETPDMLRWRAEMLLDEMMVGAVDTSAGAGERAARPAGFESEAHASAGEYGAQAAQAGANFQERASTAPSGAEYHDTQLGWASASRADGGSDRAADATAESTIVSASVRAALPPRSPTRVVTPIVREKGHENGSNGNGYHAAGANGAGAYNGNGHGANGVGNNGHTGYKLDSVDGLPAEGHPDVQGDGIEGAIADDGRPVSGEAVSGEPVEGRAAEGKTLRDSGSSLKSDSGYSSSVEAQSGLTRGTGFVVASQQGQGTDTPRTPALPSVDPLDDLDAYPPLPPSAYAPRGDADSTQTRLSVERQQRAPVRTSGAASGRIAPQEREGTASNLRSVESTYVPPAYTPQQPGAYVPPAPVDPATRQEPGSSSLVGYEYRTIGAPYGAGDQQARDLQGRDLLGREQQSNERQTRRLTAVEQRYPKPIRPGQDGTVTSNAVNAAPAGRGAHNDSTNDLPVMGGLGPVRLNPAVVNSASITGAMSVGSRAHSRYASLLPRATPWDLHEMEREIASLQEEMARVMPSGHESSRRAHHLLEKAQTIFAGDPLRSAEVDYYLTQVRAIVQRSRQTMQWSESYRQQLNKYHRAWILLSMLMLALAIVFGDQLTQWAISFFGLNPAGLIAAYTAPAVVAMFAGSLGAGIGALLNIRRYHRLDLGYFDRKYSLRGLMLPIIGLLGGLVFSMLFGGLYWMMGTVAPLPLVLELLPAVLAFGLGFLQESIYGTRE